MKSTQISLERPGKALERKCNLSSCPSINKDFMGTSRSRSVVSFSKENFSSIRPQQRLESHNELPDNDHVEATNCLSTIDDPLWKHVCCDVINMMGAASFLKIWDSTLGDVCSQDQSLEIQCQTEETAQFIQQYDFVILGSLQPYLPALKQLRATIATA